MADNINAKASNPAAQCKDDALRYPSSAANAAPFPEAPSAMSLTGIQREAAQHRLHMAAPIMLKALVDITHRLAALSVADSDDEDENIRAEIADIVIHAIATAT